MEKPLWLKKSRDFFLWKNPGLTGGNEQMLKVPASTFKCTVIEGIDGEARIKYWMINDLPGVYAKTICESVDPFGDTEYVVKELTKIVI